MKRILLLAGFVVLTGCARNTTEAPSQEPQLPPADSSSVSSQEAPDTSDANFPVQDIQLISPAGATLIVHAEIASTPSQQEQGLMQRTALPPDTGMLFIFSQSQQLSFWMKNTLIPLDVLFFDAEGNFVSSATMTPCTADPCTIYSSQGEVLSALEVAPGFTTDHGIGAGWKILMP